jgi:hypothetical protein
MRARTSRGEWAAIVGAFERSGQSHVEFCSKRGLEVQSFRGWLYRLRKAERAAPEVALVPIEVTAGPSSPLVTRAGVPAELVLAVSDLEVRVSVGTDIEYVARLVAELRARC